SIVLAREIQRTLAGAQPLDDLIDGLSLDRTGIVASRSCGGAMRARRRSLCAGESIQERLRAAGCDGEAQTPHAGSRTSLKQRRDDARCEKRELMAPRAAGREDRERAVAQPTRARSARDVGSDRV